MELCGKSPIDLVMVRGHWKLSVCITKFCVYIYTLFPVSSYHNQIYWTFTHSISMHEAGVTAYYAMDYFNYSVK